MFLPTTPEELKKLGWKYADVIIVSGDTYIDSYYNGAAVIGKYLQSHGFNVAIIAQPESDSDIKRLREPKLFWGVTGGSVDSMVANYTALKKRKKSDDLTPGRKNEKRPDRAVISYTNLIRKNFKNTVPVILGGIEASLRRVTHYDFWSNKIRRPIVFNSKADAVIFGMGEKTALEVAKKIKDNKIWQDTHGLAYISKKLPEEALELPSYKEVIADKKKFIEMFHLFYKNRDPISANMLAQKCGDRYLVQNKPQSFLSESEMDKIYSLNFERDVHPYYKKMGEVRSMDTIKYSVTTHRGCYGECNFCSIALHQSSTVQSRSINSIVKEIKKISQTKDFKGYISDIGGPTANMYKIECKKKNERGSCFSKKCLYPSVCKALRPSHKKQIELLKKLKELPGVKKVFVASGIRYDLVFADNKFGDRYLREVINHHTSGQMKSAPEHIDNKILGYMGKSSNKEFYKFVEIFKKINKANNKKQFLTYYFIAAHPGCTEKDMKKLKSFVSKKLKLTPEQVQIFTPIPSTYSTLMYYTEMDPFTGEKIFVEKDPVKKEKQKKILTAYKSRMH